jgi:hypothetical protein
MMTQHRINEICNVNNTKSLELEVLLEEPSAMTIELLGQQALTIAHIIINVNLNRSQEMSKNKKKGQVIITLTLKRKVKCHYTKQNDGIFAIDKEQNNSSFLFSTNKFLLFSISKMNIKESFIEKL